MKREDLRAGEVYLWTTTQHGEEVEVEVEFIELRPSQSPVLTDGVEFPSVSEMRPQCEVKVLQTDKTEQACVDDLRERPEPE